MQPNSIAGASAPKLAPDAPQPGPEAVLPAAESGYSRKVHFPGEDGGRSLNDMAERDLEATLQLLAERAQYITGATGAAIALRDGGEIVCRASAGSVAPEIGAHLQMDSGLSGESIRTKQILRCDDAQTDTRVNRESCEALGIASVVVMPLLRDDQVNGVFELLSDRPFAFEERDIGALERLGEMVQTALDHATAARHAAEPIRSDTTAAATETPLDSLHVETAQVVDVSSDEDLAKDEIELETAEFSAPMVVSPVTPGARDEVAKAESAVEAKVAEEAEVKATADPAKVEAVKIDAAQIEAAVVGNKQKDATELVAPPIVVETETSPAAFVADAPTFSEAAAPTDAPKISGVSQVRKCSTCGFPVSEGRTLCLDCEKKQKPTPTVTSARVESADEGENVAAPLFTMGGEAEGQSSWLKRNRILMLVTMVVVGLVVVLFLFR